MFLFYLKGREIDWFELPCTGLLLSKPTNSKDWARLKPSTQSLVPVSIGAAETTYVSHHLLPPRVARIGRGAKVQSPALWYGRRAPLYFLMSYWGKGAIVILFLTLLDICLRKHLTWNTYMPGMSYCSSSCVSPERTVAPCGFGESAPGNCLECTGDVLKHSVFPTHSLANGEDG